MRMSNSRLHPRPASRDESSPLMVAKPSARAEAHARSEAEALSRTESISKSFAPPGVMGGGRTLGWSSPAGQAARSRAHEAVPTHYAAQSRDRFTELTPNPVKVVTEEPVSTFSIDVDTAAYAFMRAALNHGRLPHRDAVRTEELVNYFPYDYAPPESSRSSVRDPCLGDSGTVERRGPAAAHRHQGLCARPQPTAPRANLVFLVDTSGSMNESNKLPLLVRSLELLLSALAPEDRVAIVTYAGSASVVLAPTPVAERSTILASLERLHAGGSTAGAQGIHTAYRLAGQHFVEDGVNRVILATDGDFNVGITDPDVRWRTTSRAGARAGCRSRCSASGWATTTTS